MVSAHFDHLANAGVMDSEGGLAAILRREGLSQLQWQKTLDLIHVPDAAENRRLMTPGPGGLEACLEKMSAVMLREQLLQEEVKARPLLTQEFLKEGR